jgi:2-dehydropantoate 2-reductase
MEIIVLGAGAIGSLYAAKLAATNDITVIAREAHVAAIKASGLRIEGIESNVIKLDAVTSVKAVGPETLILVTTKVTDSHSALAPLASLVREDTTILCLQNGLGSERIAREALGNRGIVLRGITQFGAIYEKPGVIRFMARGHTIIEQGPRSGRIAAEFSDAGLHCRISDNIESDVWQKLLVNCVVNPITAIIGCEVGGIAKPELDPLSELVIEECLAVGRARGLSFDNDFLHEIKEFFRPSHNIASMLQDLRRGRRTEIDYLNGAVAAAGRERGIDCPVNFALTSIIKAMEARSLLPEKMLEPQSA